MSDQMQKIVDALEIGLHSVRGDLARARVEQDKMGWFSERVEIVEGEVVTVQNALAAARKMRDAEPVAIGEIDSCGDGFFVELYPERDLTVGAKVYTAPPPVEASQQQADWPECSGDPMSCPENEGYGCCKPNRSASQQQCPCGDRPATECPGEWEPGCDLGANEEFARRVAEPASGKKADPTPDYWVLEDEYHIVAVDQEPSTPGISWTPVWREPPTVYAELSRLAAELSAAKAEASRLHHALECIAVDLQQHFDGIGMEYSSSYHHSVILPEAIRAVLSGSGHYVINHKIDDEARASLERFMEDQPRDREDRIVQMMRQYRAEAEAMRKDAERYRTWRHAFREGECDFYNSICNAESEAEHDAAIDAAIAASKAQQGGSK